MTNAQWRRRAAFAEPAEVLGIPTDWVLAMLPNVEGRSYVIYTPDQEALDDEMLFSAYMKRTAEGILVLDSVPKAHPDMWDRIMQLIEEALEDE